MSEFLNDFVVGIDVSSEFSVVAMLEPKGSLIRKPFRIDHNPAGFNKLLAILKRRAAETKAHLLCRIYGYLSFATLLLFEIE